ncbi:MAG TPA: hypothetical protein VG455_04725 [Acidimicrobiales bacterium]|nr:hypothetical protein [Acidimicrobiales bacterium]
MRGSVTDYDAAIRAAEEEAADHRFKDAYNTLGTALSIGGPRDRECRYRRGVYALRVAQTRLDALDDTPDRSRALNKIACWLSRSQAYLTSSGEQASPEDLARIARDLERLGAEKDRFRARWAAASRAS